MKQKDKKRETVKIMADFGMGPYAWNCGNIADAVCGFPPEYGVSKELETDFAEWVTKFERDCDKPDFEWDAFNRRGIELARKLKKEIGNRFDIEYRIPIEDPRWHEDYSKWSEESIIPITD